MPKRKSDRLLQMLRESALFAPELPKRPRFSHAEWASLSEDKQRQAYEAERIAGERVANAEKLADAVRQLGEAKQAEAVPLLANLWADCAESLVRNAAGHALREIGSETSRQALIELIEDHDHLSTFLAVATVFDAGPATAFDFFSPYFEPGRVEQRGGAVIPNEVLGTFSPKTFSWKDGESVPGWMRAAAPSWLQEESRWIERCVALRKDKRLGRIARDVLRYADPELVAPALEAAKRQEPRRRVRRATKSKGDLVARYVGGEHEAVWKELRAYEALGGDLLAEARAVAKETMQRVAHNADLVGERLAALGWQTILGELRMPPQQDDQDVMRQIEAITGAPLPLSLRVFWEEVGGVCWMWCDASVELPDLGVELAMAEMDPLFIMWPEIIPEQFETWERQRTGVDPELVDPFALELAPDFWHKASISGGAPYAIELPFLGVDPIFAEEAHELPFVDYLRLCFRWAGFSRLDRHADRADVRKFVKKMTKGLEPF